jgi:hypothetical protein
MEKLDAQLERERVEQEIRAERTRRNIEILRDDLY